MKKELRVFLKYFTISARPERSRRISSASILRLRSGRADWNKLLILQSFIYITSIVLITMAPANVSAKIIQEKKDVQQINIPQKNKPLDTDTEQKIIDELKIFVENSFEKQKKLRNKIKILLGKHIDFLITQKIDLNEYKYTGLKENDSNYYLTPIHVAALIGYIKGIKTLLAHNADPNLPNSKLNTPLHYTINETIATELIKKGAIVNTKNYIGSTPLHQTTRYGNVRVVAILIENNAEINDLNHVDRSCLHLAIENRDVKICELLINSGADLNSNQNSVKYTPIHTAILGLNKKICKLLIEKGADINLKDIYGNTPLDLLNKLDKI